MIDKFKDGELNQPDVKNKLNIKDVNNRLNLLKVDKGK